MNTIRYNQYNKMTLYSKNMAGTKKVLDKAITEQNNENDSSYLVCGPEGIGKSNFVLDCIEYIEKKKGIEIPIEKICRNLKEFVVQLRHSADRELVVLDEGEELASDNQHDATVKAVKKIYSVIRFKSLISFICFRNPLKIHTYWREDRVKGIFIITKRGQLKFYTRTLFINILEEIKKKHGGVKSIKQFNKFQASMEDTFKKYDGHLLEQYKQRKREGANNDIEELYEEFGLEERQYSLRAASKFLGIDIGILSQFIIRDPERVQKGQVIPVKWNLAKTKMKIKETDLLNFKLWYQEQRRLKQIKQTDTAHAQYIESEKKSASENKNLIPEANPEAESNS